DFISKGNRAQAQTIIADILQADPRNAEAWYLTSLLTDDPVKQAQALQRALAVDPSHAGARSALTKLQPHRDAVEELLAIPLVSAPSQSNTNRMATLVGIGAGVGALVALIVVGLFAVLPRTGLLAVPTPTATAMPTNTATSTTTPTAV